MITISTRVDASPRSPRLPSAIADICCTVGTHPHQAHEEPEASVEQLVASRAHPKCVGIGEAGLDYHYDRAPRDIAARVFRTHIAAARAKRAAARHPRPRRRRGRRGNPAGGDGEGRFHRHPALLHRGSRCWRKPGLALGLYVSFSGVVTFKNSESCVPSRATCRSTACWSRPTRPSWRRCRIAASATSRLSSPTRRACWPS